MIRVKNWAKFQHFKDRRPPWIKLYRDLLDDINFFTLSDRAGKYLPLIWLVASEKDGGLPPCDELAFRLRMSRVEVDQVIDELSEAGFVTQGQEQIDDEKPVTAKDIAARNGFGSRHISDITKRNVWARDGGKCRQCEATQDIEYDHIHPVSKGGNSEDDNVQLLCRPCNRKKRAKTAYQDATHAQSLRSLERETEREEETEERRGAIALSPSLPRKRKTLLPDDFGISPRVAAWAAEKGFDRLAEHLEAFKRKCIAKGYMNISWDDAFMEAIREDWAKLRGRSFNGVAPPPDVQPIRGRDPALQKLDDDARITKPPSLAVLQRLAEIRNGAAA